MCHPCADMLQTVGNRAPGLRVEEPARNTFQLVVKSATLHQQCGKNKEDMSYALGVKE